jgi:hypothetical protein
MHEIFVDYLQCSMLYREETCREQKHKDISPTKWYSRGYEDEIGVRRFYGNPKSKKAMIIYSGRALHNMRVAGWDVRERINSILANGGNVTRIDWAITDYVDEFLITPKLVKTLVRQGRVTGTLAKHGGKFIAGQKVGAPQHIETFYIGDQKKRGKSGIFRAYDKGIELGLSQDLITRLELEERGENAHNSAKRYAMRYEIPAIMNTRLQWRHNDFNRVFEAEPIDMSRGEQIQIGDERMQNDKRWQWLEKQVAPALRKAIKNDEKFGLGNERLLQFLESVGIIADNDNEVLKEQDK